MLEFKQDDVTAAMILTLTESVTLASPYFLFTFTHVTTKDVVSFVKAQGDDESAYTDRYNQFTINPSVIFAGYQPGEWHYTIYEQASSANTDTTGLTAIEYGKLYLDRATDFEFTKYDSATSYKTYNG